MEPPPTPERLNALAELDVQIAKCLFGSALDYEAVHVRAGRPCIAGPETPHSIRLLPYYSSDWNDMATVVERLRERGWLVKMQEMPDGTPWLANDVDEADNPIYKKSYVELSYMKGRTSTDPAETRRYIHCHLYGTAETTPEALCLAALDTLTADLEP